jgi:hypothetical protein
MPRRRRGKPIKPATPSGDQLLAIACKFLTVCCNSVDSGNKSPNPLHKKIPTKPQRASLDAPETEMVVLDHKKLTAPQQAREKELSRDRPL